MIEIKGKYNTAKVFTDNVEGQAVAQIMELCNQEFVKDSIIRIMPDTHAGAGCTIGTTEGIYSTTVNRSTLDECALAYKPMDEIIGNIKDSVEIVEIIKPIYNFKAAE